LFNSNNVFFYFINNINYNKNNNIYNTLMRQLGSALCIEASQAPGGARVKPIRPFVMT